MSFFCKDEWFQPVLNDPHAYVEKLRQYECVIGMDCSPFDNMPAWIADHQIGMNLMYDFFTDKEFIHRAKPVCREIMIDLQDLVCDEGFTCQFFGVGSAVRNMYTRDGDGPIDFDYNLNIIPCPDWEDGGPSRRPSANASIGP